MIDEMIEEFSEVAPLVIDRTLYESSVLVLGGSEWHLTLVCYWELSFQGEVMFTSDDEERIVSYLDVLRGRSIYSVARHAQENDKDPRFDLGGTMFLDIIAESYYDPWVFSFPGSIFVGTKFDG
jgi:hypothetical protein